MIKRRVYTKEFKIEAVELTERSEKTVKDISDELGIPYQLLCKWRSKYLKEGMDSFPGHGNLKESGYKSKIEAKRKIFEYIEYFYNSKRLHSFLGYYTPREYLEKYYRGYYKWTGHEVQVLRIA